MTLKYINQYATRSDLETSKGLRTCQENMTNVSTSNQTMF